MKILLLGSNGQLGKELERQFSKMCCVLAFSRTDLDITDHSAVTNAVLRIHPDIIVNAAAYTAVDKAENETELAYAINADAVAHLAQLAKIKNAWLIHYSTDYVFDGSKPDPYDETDIANPINAYGASKLTGEQAIAKSACKHLTFRTSWIIGKDGQNFAKTILRLAKERDSLNVVSDQQGVPTTPSLIAKVTKEAIHAIKNNVAWPHGIYHLTPQGVSNWYEIAITMIDFAKRQHIPLRASTVDIHPITTEEYPTAAIRPLNSQLNTQKLRALCSFNLPHWKDDFLTVVSDIISESQAS